jgi:hypothetical protein
MPCHEVTRFEVLAHISGKNKLAGSMVTLVTGVTALVVSEAVRQRR